MSSGTQGGDFDRAAASGYTAALFDLFGRVNLHEYAERDGRWYLDVTISEPPGMRLPFDFLRQEFGGRVVHLTSREGEKFAAWRAIGPRAYEVLWAIRPYVVGPLPTIDFALDVFQNDVKDDYYDDER